MIFTHAALCVSMAIAVIMFFFVTHRYCIKTDKVSWNFFVGLVAPSLWFYYTTYGCKILMGNGACHLGGLHVFQSENA